MSLENKRIVVIGGAGFIGSHLVDELIKEKPECISIVDNFFLGRENNLDEAKKNFAKIKVYHSDASDYNILKRVLEKENADVVYNLAMIPLPASLEYPLDSTIENIKIVTNVCELLRKGLFKKLIHFSSSESYGSAIVVPMNEEHPLKVETPYAASKAAGDLIVNSYVRTFKLPISILRPFNNYGPRQNSDNFAGIIPIAIKKILKNEDIIIYGNGEQTRDWTFVKDVARAAVEFGKLDNLSGKVINVAAGRELTINYIVKCVVKEFPDYKGKIIHGPERPGDVLRHFADINLARGLLNFEPKISFEEGIKTTCDWYKNLFK